MKCYQTYVIPSQYPIDVETQRQRQGTHKRIRFAIANGGSQPHCPRPISGLHPNGVSPDISIPRDIREAACPVTHLVHHHSGLGLSSR